jgi:protein-tyrosine-phosphatase
MKRCPGQARAQRPRTSAWSERMDTTTTRSRSPALLRRSVVLALTAAPVTALAAPCPPTRVLFVCPAGTVKSPIAREFLKTKAGSLGLDLDVRSRGVAVEHHVSDALAARLKADHIDPAAQPARALAAMDVEEADIVVAFDAAADDPRLSRARAWRTPSWNDDYDAAKADMLTRIGALTEELARRAKSCG